MAGALAALVVVAGLVGSSRATRATAATTTAALATGSAASAGSPFGLRAPFAGRVGLNSAPSTPTVVSPLDGYTSPTTNPVLSVTSSDPDGDPINYQFQVSSSNQFGTILCQSGWLTTTPNWTLPDDCVTSNLINPGSDNYYWRAQAEDNQGHVSAWMAGKLLHVNLVPFLGVRDNWPIWSHGPVQVNEASGDLILTAPGPSFPSIAGSFGVHPVYDSRLMDASQGAPDIGLGPGWRLTIEGPEALSMPWRLVDHTGLASSKLDALELQFPLGPSEWFYHVGDTATFLPLPRSGLPGEAIVESTESPPTYSFTDADGSVYHFAAANASGVAPLTSVKRPQPSGSANALTLTYTFATSDPSKLTRITDPAGRTLTLTWNALDSAHCPSPWLLCVTGPDQVQWKYGHLNRGAAIMDTVFDGTRNVFRVGYDTASPTIRVNVVWNANDLDPSHASPGYSTTHGIAITYKSSSDDTDNRVNTVADGPISTQPSGKQTSTWLFQYLPGPFNTTLVHNDHPG